MVYVVDLDDTLVCTKNLNNDAYNYALEKNGERRVKTKKRLTRDNLGREITSKIIADKQNYFVQKWVKYRVVINEYLLNILQKQGVKNCFLWTSADVNRATYILKELDLNKYFNKVIFDDKKDFNISLKRLKDITKSNVFLIFEDNEDLIKNQKIKLIEKINVKDFRVNKYLLS